MLQRIRSWFMPTVERHHDDALGAIAKGTSGLDSKARDAALAEAILATTDGFDALVQRALVRMMVGLIGTLASLAILWDVATSVLG